MTCAACGDDSGAKPFCGTCWKVCPEPTRQALRSGSATVKRVAEMIRLRRQPASEVHAGDRMRRSGRFADAHYARVNYRRAK